MPRAEPRLTPGTPRGATDVGVAPKPPKLTPGGRTAAWGNDIDPAVDAAVPRGLNPGRVGRIPAWLIAGNDPKALNCDVAGLLNAPRPPRPPISPAGAIEAWGLSCVAEGDKQKPYYMIKSIRMIPSQTADVRLAVGAVR